MKLLVTGICGFVGSALAREMQDRVEGVELFGIDNLIRPGAHLNRPELLSRGVRLWHGDVRMASDWETLPPADWLIDAAANPSVLAGVDGQTSSRQLVEHNPHVMIHIGDRCIVARDHVFEVLSTRDRVRHQSEGALAVAELSGRSERTPHFPVRGDGPFVGPRLRYG